MSLHIVKVNHINNIISLNDGRLFHFNELDHEDLIKLFSLRGPHQTISQKLTDEAFEHLLTKLEDVTFNAKFDNV